MRIYITCPACPCSFSDEAHAPMSEVLDRMSGDAPWFALAVGATFGEMVEAALRRRGRILCPDCRGEVLVECDGSGLAAEPPRGVRREA
jgi:hypothetical protein